MASDLVGYGPYLERVPEIPGQERHASDNRVELTRARQALALVVQSREALEGGKTVFEFVSGGAEQTLVSGAQAGRLVDR